MDRGALWASLWGSKGNMTERLNSKNKKKWTQCKHSSSYERFTKSHKCEESHQREVEGTMTEKGPTSAGDSVEAKKVGNDFPHQKH